MSPFLKSRTTLGFFVLVAGAMLAFSANAQVPPSNISAVAAGACQINLSWTPGQYPFSEIRAEHFTPTPSAICSFSAPFTLTATTTSGVTTFVHTQNSQPGDPYVGPNSLYCYWVRSRTLPTGLCGGTTPCSNWSQAGPGNVIASTTTPLIPAPSNATLTLAIARDSGARVDLQWATSTVFSDPANAFYNIYRDGANIASIPAFQDIGGIFVPMGYYQDMTVSADTVYRYQVQASQGAAGCVSVTSRRNSALSTALTVPTMPVITGIAYSPTSTPNGIGPLRIDWTEGSGPAGRQINLWKREANEATSTRYKSFPPGTFGYDEDPATLILDTSYGYQMQACASVFSGAKYIGTGCSDMTPEAQVAIVNTPQDVRARLYYVDTVNETADILLSWENSFPDENYAIERSSNGGVDWSLVSGTSYTDSDSATIFLYRDLNVPLKALYKYRVSLDQGGGVLSDGKETDIVSTRIEKVFYGNAYASVGPGYTPPVLPSPSPVRLQMRGGVGFLEGFIPAVSAAFAPIPVPAPAPMPALTPIPVSDGGAGWISFNSDYPGKVSVHNYSVQVNEEGVLSGAAWAAIRNPNDDSTFAYGWLSFNREDLYGCPGQLMSVPCTGRWDRTTGKVTGWAKFIGFENVSSPDKWFDGWVSLAKFGSAPSIYGSAIDDSLKQLIGTAWGAFRNTAFSQGLGGTGWISMGNSSCPRGQCNIWYTPLVNPPLVSSVTVDTIGSPWTQDSKDPPPLVVARWSGSPFCASSTHYSVSWQYTGPVLEQTQVEFYPVGGTGKTVTLDYGPITNMQFPQAEPGRPLGNLPGTLDYDTNYRVRVRAATKIVNPVDLTTSLSWSAWTSSAQFLTPSHYYPLVQFTSAYKGPNLSGEYQYGFDGSLVSLDRSVGGSQEFPMGGWNWAWDFGNASAGFGNPSTASGNPSATAFQTTSTYPVMLTVDDGGGGICSYTYEEVSPQMMGDQPRRRIWVEP